MCLLRINLPNLCPNMNHFDAVDFSECHSEEVISFFWRSVYSKSSRFFLICNFMNPMTFSDLAYNYTPYGVNISLVCFMYTCCFCENVWSFKMCYILQEENKSYKKFSILVHSKNTRVKVDPEKVHCGQTPFGSTMTPKSVNLTRNMTQSWVNLTPLFVKSAESWPISGSSLTRNGVWPQWTLSGSCLTGVFFI